MPPPTHKLETVLVHAGTDAQAPGKPKVVPIVRSTVFEAHEQQSYHDIVYGRLSTLPGHAEVCAVLARCENGEAALVTSSGMAAITTALLAILEGGGHVLAQRPLYGASQNFLAAKAPALGISTAFIDVHDPATWEQHLTQNTRAIYVESISNPLLEVADHRLIAEFAKQHGLVSIIDNTFASPINFRPLELGFDLVVHSATKYLNGHSDLCAGAVVGSAQRIASIKTWLDHLGGCADPETCFLLRRGLKTLALRVARQNQNAQRLAEFLEAHPSFRSVRYPGLESHPDHQQAKTLFDGFGGMLVCELAGGEPQALRFTRATQVVTHSASLGGPETLVTLPARTSHAGLSKEERAQSGISDGLMRISVGIEHIDDLLADFEQASQA